MRHHVEYRCRVVTIARREIGCPSSSSIVPFSISPASEPAATPMAWIKSETRRSAKLCLSKLYVSDLVPPQLFNRPQVHQSPFLDDAYPVANPFDFRKDM